MLCFVYCKRGNSGKCCLKPFSCFIYLFIHFIETCLLFVNAGKYFLNLICVLTARTQNPEYVAGKNSEPKKMCRVNKCEDKPDPATVVVSLCLCLNVQFVKILLCIGC